MNYPKLPWTSTYNHCPQYGSGEIRSAEGEMLAIVSGPNYGLCLEEADWDQHGTCEIMEGVGRLMANAPLLYETLQTMVEVMEKIGVPDDPISQKIYSKTLAVSKITLAIARGEQK